jgi:hypothetical protein
MSITREASDTQETGIFFNGKQGNWLKKEASEIAILDYI